MFVCCECCVLWGRGFCDELITCPEKSYRMWCVVVCDLETSRMRRPWPALGRNATAKKKLSKILCKYLLLGVDWRQIYIAKTKVKRESLFVKTYVQSRVLVFQFFVKGFCGDTEFGIRSSKRKEPLTTKHSSNWI
jgi:hypothetical protein